MHLGFKQLPMSCGFLVYFYILNDPASYEVITVFSDSLTFCAWNTLMSDMFIGAHYLD